MSAWADPHFDVVARRQPPLERRVDLVDTDGARQVGEPIELLERLLAGRIEEHPQYFTVHLLVAEQFQLSPSGL